MAKYEYKPLTGGKRKSSNTRYLILALVVIIVGTVVLIKTRGEDPGAGVGTDNPTVANESAEVYALPSQTSDPAPAGSKERAAGPAGTTDPIAVPPPANTAAANNTSSAFNPVPPSTASMSEATLSAIEQALKQLEGGQVIAARDSLNAVLAMEMTPEYRTSVKKKLAELSQNWLFSKTVFPGDELTEMYTVQSGEVLANIGKKFNVPYEILQQINNISRPERLQAGQKIKVIKGPFHIKVYRSAFTMDLYLGSQMYVKGYRVGLGAMNNETPPGRWRVKAGGRLIEPKWTHPVTQVTYTAGHPEYPLGSRWIEIEGLEEANKQREGFAIHGTREPESIGTRSSMGCIRLFNGDAIEVYNLLVEQKSEVRIVD